MTLSENMRVPLVDLKVQYLSIKDEIDRAIRRVIDNTSFIGGDDVREFEESFADYCNTKHCIGVGNGTDALYLALRCLGITAGDEVITVSNTFIATTEAISMVGAKPVFVDIDEKTFNIDPLKLENLLKDKVEKKDHKIKAIIPVHLYGQPCDMAPILRIAKRYDLKVIEDAAQAHGALYAFSRETVNQEKKTEKSSVTTNQSLSRRIGSIGDVGCFSFYPGKNLGAYGDGGAIVTNDDDLAQKMRMFANHGRKKKYEHECEGANSRLDTIQAAILNVKLKYLEAWTEKRRQNAEIYKEILSDKFISNFAIHPFEAGNVRHVYHLYVVRVDHRKIIRNRLNEKGISTGIHYPTPLHLSRAYKYLNYKQGDFPITEKASKEILSLPMYPELTSNQIQYICDCLCDSIIKS